jgi:tRNA pseudouridine38-40 synthase
MRLALGVEYDGSGFSGWQRLSVAGSQARDGSLQTALESALSRVANAPVTTVCAGRTDSGVHARCQVVHFDTEVVRTTRAWQLGTTSNLPKAMSVRWCVPVADDFSARFSARARRYRYRIFSRMTRTDGAISGLGAHVAGCSGHARGCAGIARDAGFLIVPKFAMPGQPCAPRSPVHRG